MIAQTATKPKGIIIKGVIFKNPTNNRPTTASPAPVNAYGIWVLTW